jgi:hypothetical protein
MKVADALLARVVREEVRNELRDRMLPSVMSFLNDEIGTVDSIEAECNDEAQKAQLSRLSADLAVVRQGLEAFVATSVALLQDR